ncbi:universal stress protein [Pseudorhodobacter sp. W20_MBD10_FR17]|uniref:universal stress protein n=1 Tax=Pseudorhodobacter sp. W20_MBD10_FR17 TaxID=3240266 RepID=UPI003F9BD5AA
MGLLVSSEAEWLINKVITIATALDAHVTGLHAHSSVVFLDGIANLPMVYSTLQEWGRNESDKIRDLFGEQMRKNGISAEFRRQEILYDSEDFLLSSARGSDLGMIGGHGSGTRSPDDRAMVDRLIRNIGCPVLVVSPESALNATFQNITVGWSETCEATRAAHDALDLAKAGADIDLIRVVARTVGVQAGFDSRDDFATALDRRGFKVRTADRMATVENRGKDLLRVLIDTEVDLLVVGAFGDSRIYGFAVGAVTTHLLKKAKLPVLLSR